MVSDRIVLLDAVASDETVGEQFALQRRTTNFYSRFFLV